MSDEVRYPWQQALRDAFLAPPSTLAAKIRAAYGAIAARLREPTQPDNQERIALNDAMRGLQVLMREAEAHGHVGRTSKGENRRKA